MRVKCPYQQNPTPEILVAPSDLRYATVWAILPSRLPVKIVNPTDLLPRARRCKVLVDPDTFVIMTAHEREPHGTIGRRGEVKVSVQSCEKERNTAPRQQQL